MKSGIFKNESNGTFCYVDTKRTMRAYTTTDGKVRETSEQYRKEFRVQTREAESQVVFEDGTVAHRVMGGEFTPGSTPVGLLSAHLQRVKPCPCPCEPQPSDGLRCPDTNGKPLCVDEVSAEESWRELRDRFAPALSAGAVPVPIDNGQVMGELNGRSIEKVIIDDVITVNSVDALRDAMKAMGRSTEISAEQMAKFAEFSASIPKEGRDFGFCGRLAARKHRKRGHVVNEVADSGVYHWRRAS